MNHQLTAADMAAVAKAENAAARKLWGGVRWHNIGSKTRIKQVPRKNSPVAQSIIQAIADGNTTRAEIAEATGRDPSRIGSRVKDLCTAGLINRSGPKHRKEYTLTDAGRAWLEAQE